MVNLQEQYQVKLQEKRQPLLTNSNFPNHKIGLEILSIEKKISTNFPNQS